MTRMWSTTTGHGPEPVEGDPRPRRGQGQNALVRQPTRRRSGERLQSAAGHFPDNDDEFRLEPHGTISTGTVASGQSHCLPHLGP